MIDIEWKMASCIQCIFNHINLRFHIIREYRTNFFHYINLFFPFFYIYIYIYLLKIFFFLFLFINFFKNNLFYDY